MKRYYLSRERNFYKANLHCHTTNSDGAFTPEEIKEEYKKRGYSVVAFTDHEHLIDNSYLCDDDFLAITACEVAVKEFAEVSTLKDFDMRVAHLNFYALDPHNTITPCYNSVYDHFLNNSIRDKVRHSGEYERNYSPEGINAMVAEANGKGFLVSYNHPSWSLENATDYLQYSGFFAVEIYNHGCVTLGGYDDERVLDDMLRAGKAIFATCADDNHNKRPTDPFADSFGGWVVINSAALTYRDIMFALENGDFYASCGPEIYSLYVENEEKVRLTCSPCVKASLITRGRRTRAVTGQGLCEVEFDLRPTDGWFRIVLQDEKGNKAYTQAYMP